jgi:hypothetical protein
MTSGESNKFKSVGQGGSAVRFPAGAGNFSHLRYFTQWVPGVLSPEVKRPGREADYSLPSSAEVMNMQPYSSTSNMSSRRGA